MNYLTYDTIKKLINQNHYASFDLFFMSSIAYGAWKHAIKFENEAAASLKIVQEKPEIVEACLFALDQNIKLYEDLPNVVFKVSLKLYKNDTSPSGPHEFVLKNEPVKQNDQQPNSSNLFGIGNFGINELTNLIAIQSKASLNDYREIQLNAREQELKADIEDFEKLKQNPAAANISKGVNIALTKFFNAIDPDEATDLSGQQNDATMAAETLANDLVNSGMSAEEIKNIHEVIKKNKIKEEVKP